ncbi:MAG: hypothetical protein A2W22_05540 [Candidatus Levybacteria bacterium RBG_16_35_11]|nr:MAG: hypothetical protein A2W22_05540 [Candidatus Levybacteria bacterium RBG_16_35_11]
MTDFSLSGIKDREEMIRLFDGYSIERKEELDQKKTKKGLVKSYLLETVDGFQDTVKTFSDILIPYSSEFSQIDEGLYKVSDKISGKYMGFLESFWDGRYIVFYSLEHSEIIDKWIKNLVLSSPLLDHVWLSGWTFEMLWEKVKELSNPNRFTRIVFEHESIFEIDSDIDEINNEEEIVDEEDQPIFERRSSKIALVDRIRLLKDKLSHFQKLYSPMYSITQLRFPSPIAKGGHDFFHFGKATNRSESFRDHRSHVLYILKIYRELIKRTQDIAWYSIEKVSVQKGGEFQKLIGAPLIVEFKDPLNEETFNHFIDSTFRRVKNRFRFWGNPIKLGPKKVHVYGVDKHLWQPIFLEITDKHIIAIIPKGTCGNTVHRLVSNIQIYLDPAAKITLGNKPYREIADDSSKGITYEQY